MSRNKTLENHRKRLPERETKSSTVERKSRATRGKKKRGKRPTGGGENES